MQAGAFGSVDSLAADRDFFLNLNSNSMLQGGPPEGWADLPEELLVSVFNALDQPRDLLACACVCNAWRNGKGCYVCVRFAAPRP